MRDAGRLEAEALRLNARYVEEVVIGWDLCPWAARAWREGAVARRVFASTAPAAAEVLAFADELAARPELAIGLAVFPRATADEAAWGRFAERVRRTDRARLPPGAHPAFLLAAFHPGAGPATPPAGPAELVAFIRRTPDPTLQLVRAATLDRLGDGEHDLSAQIGRDNFATVGARGAAALDAALRDIQRDRDAAYREL